MAGNLAQALDDLARAQSHMDDARAAYEADLAGQATYQKTAMAVRGAISTTKAEIEKLKKQLAGSDLGEAERAKLLAELARLEAQLQNLEDQLQNTETELAVLAAILPIDLKDLRTAAVEVMNAMAEVSQQIALLIP